MIHRLEGGGLGWMCLECGGFGFCEWSCECLIRLEDKESEN